MNGARTWLTHVTGAVRGRHYPFVLCYHGVGSVAAADDPQGIFLSIELFERHLDTIAAQNYELLSVSELWRAIAHQPGPAGKGAITFDDGLTQTTRNAIPMVLERGWACSLFVPTGLLGKRHPDAPTEWIASAAEVRELSDAGVEVGAHSVDHVDLTRLPHVQALEQMRRSRETLEDLLAKPVKTMAYPFGAVTPRLMEAAEEAGYEVACACSGAGPWLARCLPREPVFASSSPLRLRIKMAGLYGPAYALAGARSALRHRATRVGP
jgi:peptidoglycan/xylan/chitin deacetylase (PgdA/CDA1 family)